MDAGQYAGQYAGPWTLDRTLPVDIRHESDPESAQNTRWYTGHYVRWTLHGMLDAARHSLAERRGLRYLAVPQ